MAFCKLLTMYSLVFICFSESVDTHSNMKYCETAVLSDEVEKIKVHSLCGTLAYILISSNELEVTCDAH